jgi:hypothetical protein
MIDYCISCKDVFSFISPYLALIFQKAYQLEHENILLN